MNKTPIPPGRIENARYHSSMRTELTVWLEQPLGPRLGSTSPYMLLRLKRRGHSHHRRRLLPGGQPCAVQQYDEFNDRWVSLGTFETEDEALAILEDRVEIMGIVEALREAEGIE